MTWLAICDHRDRRFSLRGLGAQKKHAPLLADHPNTRLTCGTLMFEVERSIDDLPKVLFACKTTDPEQRSLTFQSLPMGGLSLVHVQGKTISHAALHHRMTAKADVLRITYSWDTNASWGRLSLEQPGQMTLISVQVSNPQPLSLLDIRNLMLGGADHTFAPQMVFAALSDQIEAIGPIPTLHPETALATPWGYKRICELRRGDTVYNDDFEVVPVLHKLSRILPARGSYRPIRLRAPYFGLQQDIVVAPDQRLLVKGPDVAYLFGHESVLVPAKHLANGKTALFEHCGPTVHYSQLLLPAHDAILAAGTALDSLYIGRLRRNRAHLMGSMFHHLDRSGLPEHVHLPNPVLQEFEAIQMVHQRAA